jgi:DNA-damage-inducible protein J
MLNKIMKLYREDDFMPKSVTIRIDDNLKRQADETLEEIGLNMTAYFTSSLKALVREKRVPFELTTTGHNNAAYLTKLDMAIKDAKEHGVYEYLGKDENGKAKFSDTPQKATI